MRILLIGKRGQLGWELQRSLLPLGEVFAVDRQTLDLSSPLTIGPAIEAIRPDVIVNAAAYTAVDEAETHHELATMVNATAVGELAVAARKLNALLLHYSTDYVFDGLAEVPYREEVRPDPQTVYGRSKLAGEQAIADSGADWLVFRTSWVYGTNGRNFLRAIAKAACEQDALRVVADQRGTPTAVRVLADLSVQALRTVIQLRRSGDLSKLGLYHLTLRGETTWHGFAQAIVCGMRARGVHDLRATRVDEITSSDLTRAAQRPAYSVLDCGRFDAAFELARPSWDQALELVLDDMLRDSTAN
ncbi:dTDP-4-dehydrorhamnose reductase [Burkholderia ubonensis]|uniref:dTDP-4-dehydrorhamnose reductase n=1 Tax=Burkholderia ubonensis TaxID=101571 RepID=UPI000753CDF5|nr:dTDP-4-dehydrorhamnose reductase [Burkholderia ubonensis]KVX24990.1 dTDP-4-dehydrorhamnose reductase [Burkholderia ubonensis]KWB24594.1 dTDP-4-dehydrorhamnose reductase [Burkholderia ubonensis]KWC26383.1 dTDP-4-dehydrorhamnose reductase [Burkholderia ubonensis]